MNKFENLESNRDAIALARSFSEEAKRKLETTREAYVSSGEKERSVEEAELRAQEIFYEHFAEPYQRFLSMEISDGDEKFTFAVVIDKHLENIRQADSPESKLEAQKAMVRDLTERLNKIPVGDGQYTPEQTMDSKTANCSNLGAELAMMIESTKSESGIDDIKYVEPSGHIANIVHFNDGTILFADPRHGSTVDITDSVKVDERDDITVYENTKLTKEMPVRFFPAMKSLERGIAHIYAGNASILAEAAAGKFHGPFHMDDVKEQARVQEEAQAALEHLGITEEDIDRLELLDTRIGKSIHEFKDSAGYLEDRKRLESLGTGEIPLENE